MTESKTESNDLTKKKSNIGVKTNRLFFSIIFIQRFAAKIGIGVMKWLTPRLMLEHHFDELSNGVWHPIHSGNLDSETPNNRRFDWLMWPFPQIPIHQRCKHQQCNTNPRQLCSALITTGSRSVLETLRIILHCKCLQGFTGTLQGNESAGISNLQGLQVTCNACKKF